MLGNPSFLFGPIDNEEYSILIELIHLIIVLGISQAPKTRQQSQYSDFSVYIQSKYDLKVIVPLYDEKQEQHYAYLLGINSTLK